jgi:hypothetical protein
MSKSAALAIGDWDTTANIRNIPYRQEVCILGIRFTASVCQMVISIWTPIIQCIRAQAQEAYVQNLCLASQIRYIHIFLLARVWFAAQILPLTMASIRQIRTAVTWYLCRGTIFQIPYTTMTRMKLEGGWDLLDVEAMGRALLLHHLMIQRTVPSMIMSAWLDQWAPCTPGENPPNLSTILRSLEYICQYAQDRAYIPQKGDGEMHQTFKRRMYSTMVVLLRNTVEPPILRVTTLWPATMWPVVWKIVQQMPGTEMVRIKWFQLIHIVPTAACLHRINLTPTDTCRRCTNIDTLSHRITMCGDGPDQWRWTRCCIAAKLRADPATIPETWLLSPDFLLWPPKQHKMVLWMLTHMAVFRMHDDLTKHDYLDFLRHGRCKLTSTPASHRIVGNYLHILD